MKHINSTQAVLFNFIIFTMLMCFAVAIVPDSIAPLQPFSGQHMPPRKNTTVFVSVHVIKITSVDEEQYLFEGAYHIYLSWNDQRVIKTPPEPQETCRLPCNIGFEGSEQSDCCDDVWLPTVYLTNLYQYYTEATGGYATSSISVNKETGDVAWRQYVHASFFTFMDFAWFPFDEQALTIEFQSRSTDSDRMVTLQQSQLTYTQRPRGFLEDVNGWKLEDTSEDLFWGVSGVEQQCVLVSQEFADDDPFLSAVGASARGDSANTQRPQLMQEVAPKLRLFIVVNRVSEYYVISSIVPICLIIFLVFPVFFINRSKLESRLQLLVTLYLTLGASQFFIDKPKADVPLLPDQLGLVAYSILTLFGLESVLAYYVVKRRALHHKHLVRAIAIKYGSKHAEAAVNLSRQRDSTDISDSAHYSRSSTLDVDGGEVERRSGAPVQYTSPYIRSSSMPNHAPTTRANSQPQPSSGRAQTPRENGGSSGQSLPVLYEHRGSDGSREGRESEYAPGIDHAQFETPREGPPSGRSTPDLYVDAPEQWRYELQMQAARQPPQGRLEERVFPAEHGGVQSSGLGDSRARGEVEGGREQGADDGNRGGVGNGQSAWWENLCCGVVFQVKGSWDCLRYVMGRCCSRKPREEEKSAYMAYYLDVWTLLILGSFAVVTTVTMVLLTYFKGQVTQEAILERYSSMPEYCASMGGF